MRIEELIHPEDYIARHGASAWYAFFHTVEQSYAELRTINNRRINEGIPPIVPHKEAALEHWLDEAQAYAPPAAPPPDALARYAAEMFGENE